MIEAAALQRVVDLARAVRGDDHDRRLGGPDGAELRHRHLEVGQHLEQEGLEGLVGAVELVDEQDRRAALVGLKRLQKRALDEIALREQVALEPVPVDMAARLGEADRHHLAGIVPLVDRRGDVEPLVALQADQPPAERRRKHLRDLGLPDPGFALEEQGPSKLQGEKKDRRERAVGDVARVLEQGQRVVDRTRGLSQGAVAPEASSPS